MRLHGKGNSSSHGARPVHLIIKMIWWIRTSWLSIKNSLSLSLCLEMFWWAVTLSVDDLLVLGVPFVLALRKRFLEVHGRIRRLQSVSCTRVYLLFSYRVCLYFRMFHSSTDRYRANMNSPDNPCRDVPLFFVY